MLLTCSRGDHMSIRKLFRVFLPLSFLVSANTEINRKSLLLSVPFRFVVVYRMLGRHFFLTCVFGASLKQVAVYVTRQPKIDLNCASIAQKTSENLTSRPSEAR
uniref:Putative secreted protein n=1 Tax=Amblyomma cajennense TaxID=34607 RepID=A0A023FDG3_AMBCJ